MNHTIDVALRRMTEAITAGGIAGVHDPYSCLGQKCTFHRPSLHPALLWPKNIRANGLIERTCEHGVGHPDPDSAAWMESQGEMYASSHGCDGCCYQLPVLAYMKTLRWHASILHPWKWINKITKTEMSEGGLKRAPHCCSQGQCWAHVDTPWCACECRWCAIASRFRPFPKEPTIKSVEDFR